MYKQKKNEYTYMKHMHEFKYIFNVNVQSNPDQRINGSVSLLYVQCIYIILYLHTLQSHPIFLGNP